jgi:nucleoside-diphosphate-sugar epimerase
MSDALVIGGTSLIGPPLVEALLARGDQVVVMHRRSGTPFGDRVEELQADRNDAAAVRDAVGDRRFRFVFDNVYDWQRGTTAGQVLNTLDALMHDDLDRYVFISSVAAYPEGGPFAEDAALRPSSDANVYGVHKAESERALFERAHADGVPVSTTRPAFVYGPGNPFPRESFFFDRLMAGRPIIVPEDGQRTMQWVHADDVAEASVRAAARKTDGPEAFNLAGPPVTQDEFVRTLARVVGVEPDLVHMPRERIEAAGGRLLEPPFYFGAYLDIPPLTVTEDRVRDVLDLELRSLEDGMRETFAWYRRQERPPLDASWEDELIASV